MNFVSDVLVYMRRYLKTPSNASVSNTLLLDYLNRFLINDVAARIQLFDFKTTYVFQTVPGIYQYNMPLNTTQTTDAATGQVNIGFYPVYQGFMAPVRANGVAMGFYTERQNFYSLFYPFVTGLVQVALGDGTSTYDITMPSGSILPGHLDMQGIVATGSVNDPLFASSINANIPQASMIPGAVFSATLTNGSNAIVQDSGIFFSGNTSGKLYGLLMRPGNYPRGYTSFGTYSLTENTINYTDGTANVDFGTVIPPNTPINAQFYFYSQGIPRSLLFYNNTLTIHPPPDQQYRIELDAYLTPVAFLNTTGALPFAYMAEYFALGAARKMFADTGDTEQFNFYEPIFREQEMLVLTRSERQRTATRVPTIYTSGNNFSGTLYGGLG